MAYPAPSRSADTRSSHSEAASVRNLFAKDWDSAMLAVREEVQEDGPEVPLVSKPASLASRAERLTWKRSSPGGSIVRPVALP